MYGTGNFSKGANSCSFVGSNEAKIQDQIHTPDSNVTPCFVKRPLYLGCWYEY